MLAGSRSTKRDELQVMQVLLMSNCHQSDVSWYGTNRQWLAADRRTIDTTEDWERWRHEIKGGNSADSYLAVFFFTSNVLQKAVRGLLWRSAKGVRFCCPHTEIPHSETTVMTDRRPPYGRNVCCWCAAIEDELGKCSTMKGPLWRMLSDLLGWGNWKALDRSPWSPPTFIKGSGLHRKIVGLFLSVSF